MVTFKRVLTVGAVLIAGCATASAQAPTPAAAAEQIRMRQQLATMETVLQQAIGIGAQNVIAQVRHITPQRPRLGTPRASGFKLDGYGVVFYVQVPEFTVPIMWDVLVREAQDRQAAMVLQQWKTQVSTMPPGQERERQLSAIDQYQQRLRAGDYRAIEAARGSISAASLVPGGVEPSDRAAVDRVDQTVVDDPESAYTREVKAALIDAMLTNSQGLGLGADELLVVVARDGVPSNPQFPGDSIDASTWIMSVKGSVLAAFRSGSITKAEAQKQVDVKEQ